MRFFYGSLNWLTQVGRGEESKGDLEHRPLLATCTASYTSFGGFQNLGGGGTRDHMPDPYLFSFISSRLTSSCLYCLYCTVSSLPLSSWSGSAFLPPSLQICFLCLDSFPNHPPFLLPLLDKMLFNLQHSAQVVLFSIASFLIVPQSHRSGWGRRLSMMLPEQPRFYSLRVLATLFSCHPLSVHLTWTIRAGAFSSFLVSSASSPELGA